MTATTRMKVGMMMPIGVGALDGTRPVRWRELREIAHQMEAIGLDYLVVPDHLLFRKSPPDNLLAVRMPEGQTRGIWEAWTILAALAEATSRIEIGPYVACTSFRSPALLAKIADTVEEVSEGRLVLGLGAGWHQPEYDAFGYPYDHRVGRFEEALQIIVPLLKGRKVTLKGQYYQVEECELLPRGPRPDGPPILIGAERPRMLSLVARYADIYDADFQMPDVVAQRYQAVSEACRAAGRDPATLVRGAGTRIAITTPDGRIDQPHALVEDTGGPTADFAFGGMRATVRRANPEEMLAHFRAYRDLGVERLTLFMAHPTGLRALERVAPILEALRKR
jgi:alkanesulfonate monooxygenase SsuD/methylene tetrahydromethanopterin reductase-like flavin-dependent oxidoreductase (luciferase family)